MDTSALLQIPAFPPLAAKVLSLPANDQTGTAGLVRLLRSDPALSAEIIRFANSSLFALRAEVDSLDQAVTLLGLRRIRGLALSAIMRTYLKGILLIDELRSFWRYSVACALIAERISPAIDIPADTAYAAALLHDIGCLGLMMADSVEYPRLLQIATEERESGKEFNLLDQERNLFGFDRYDAGAWLARHWNLPEDLRAAAGRYSSDATGYGLIGLIVAASSLANSLGFAMVTDPRQPTYEQIRASLAPEIASRLLECGGELRAQIEKQIAMLDWDTSAFEQESAARALLNFSGQTMSDDNQDRSVAFEPRQRRPYTAILAGGAVILLVLILKLFVNP